jgi:thiosulfate/3-mercaptopyruvate sulfurtransferase
VDDSIQEAFAHALVSPDLLERELRSPGLTIAEVTGPRRTYHLGHIPGAVELTLSGDLLPFVGAEGLDVPAFAQRLGELGFTAEDRIVLYSTDRSWSAAYTYWCLAMLGHGKVKLLDGAGEGWVEQGRPTQVDSAPRCSPTVYRPSDATARIFMSTEEVLRHGGRATLLDVRTPAEFGGHSSPAETSPVRLGHIPGAVNVPADRWTRPDGIFDPGDLMKLRAEVLATAGQSPIVTYCHSGVRSAFMWFVLHELLGFSDTRNYAGSWLRYSQRKDAPVSQWAR